MELAVVISVIGLLLGVIVIAAGAKVWRDAKDPPTRMREKLPREHGDEGPSQEQG